MDEKIYTVPLDAETDKTLTLLLFSQVKNATHLRKMLMSGKLQCCIIKASMIYDPFQVTVAANKAVTTAKFNTLITKSIYTDILYNLSMSKNITQSLCNYGITDDDTEILIGLINNKDEDLMSKIKIITDIVDGQMQPICRLTDFRNIDKIKESYKIDDIELKVSKLLDSIVSRITVKGFLLR